MTFSAEHIFSLTLKSQIKLFNIESYFHALFLFITIFIADASYYNFKVLALLTQYACSYSLHGESLLRIFKGHVEN